MQAIARYAATSIAMAGASLFVLQAAEPLPAPREPGNSSYLYIGAFSPPPNGAIQVPPNYIWSVETSRRGIDAQGNNLPDSRVMLRLHNPERGFSAVTAQLDLATAAKLHHELGEVIIKKLQNPDYQDRSHVGPHQKGVPVGRFKGVDSEGTAIIEFERED